MNFLYSPLSRGQSICKGPEAGINVRKSGYIGRIIMLEDCWASREKLNFTLETTGGLGDKSLLLKVRFIEV